MYSTGASSVATEARSAPRFAVRWPVELESGQARTRDISASGMYLESDIQVEPGAVMKFAVMLPKHRGVTELLQCVGRAVRVEQRDGVGCGIGVALQEFQFNSLNAEAG